MTRWRGVPRATGARAGARRNHESGLSVVGIGSPARHEAHIGLGRLPESKGDHERSTAMSDSVYRVTDVIGVSSESWEAAARNAVETAAKTIRGLRVAEVTRTDVTIENGTIANYRVRLGISFKYETED